MNEDQPDAISLHDLYPDFTPEELAEADSNLTRYLEVVLRIYERLRADPVAYGRFRKILELLKQEEEMG